jgi:tetratricopeptide (TPR) repeat protein
MKDATDRALEILTRALSELREGRLENAESLGARLLTSSPLNPAAHQLSATIALQRGRYEDADRWARSCLALRPAHAPAMLIAGQAARAQGNFTEALEWFRRAGEASPDRPEPFFQLCLTQLECGDPAAQATLARLLHQFPDEAEGWSQIGFALRNANQLEAAALAFARAAKTSADPAHSFNLGSASLALGRPKDAVAAFRHALALSPDRLEVLLPLAQGLRQIGEAEEARAHLLRLADAQPDNGQAFYALGLACEDLRDAPGAIAAYRRCLELQPDLPEAHVNLGLALQQIGELELAMQSYRRAMRLRPDTFGRIAQALPSTYRGQLWLDLGKLRRSLGG